MRVLLTGASGFLGQYMLRMLQDSGIETIAVGRTLPPQCDSSHFRQVDLLDERNFDDLVSSIGATHLLHLAWYAEHGAYWASPLNLRWTEATVRLVEAFCRAGSQKVVLAGTCAEYEWVYGYCTEDLTPLNPSTLYGVAKDATRRLSMATCAQHNIPFAWGRIFLPYGLGEDSRRILPSLRAVFQGKHPPFGVNVSAYRDFLHAEDVAAAFIHLLQPSAAGVYNICSGQPVQLQEVVRQLAFECGADPRIILNLSTDRPGEPPFLVGSNQKLKTLGWHAKRKFTDMPRIMEML